VRYSDQNGFITGSKSMIKKCIVICISFSLQAINIDNLPKLSNQDIPDIMQATRLPENIVTHYLPILHRVERNFVNLVSNAYPVVVGIVKKYQPKTFCEVGVAFGMQSFEILISTNVEKLYGVDPYKNFPDYQDPMNLPQPLFDLVYYHVHKRFESFGSRATLIRALSVQAAQLFAPHSLDMVYIDANHSYEGVQADLSAWYDKVKPGGIISGDDYGGATFPGVTQAVDEFIARNHLTLQRDLVIEKRTWWAEKPIR